MLLSELAGMAERVRATGARNEKVALLSELLGDAPVDEVDLVVAYLSGQLRQGRIGVGPALVQEAVAASAPGRDNIPLPALNAALDTLMKATGPGSGRRRRTLLRTLFARKSPPERTFLAALLLGELRQGALEGLMLEAVARTAHVPPTAIKRALMLAGNLPEVARTAIADGSDGLKRFRIRPLSPLRPMLAQSAADVSDALERLGEAAFEFKLDGARIQVHKADGRVRVYSRRMNDVTAAVPEVAEGVAQIASPTLVLDGEALALRADGRPHPFQITMRRFGRRLDVAATRKQLPLSAFYFDCLYRDGESLIDKPAAERFAALARSVPDNLLVRRKVTSDRTEAEAFLREARACGHEGVMAKSLSAPYEAGNRGSSWLKIKPAHTLDLVVLAAEWGHGRRQGRLSNLHLGARDDKGGFMMLGKTFKGLSDSVLEWQTRRLLELQVDTDGYTVYVRPELVVEVSFNDVQTSPRYPAGLALRFARVKGYRPDKRAEDADTIETIRAIHEQTIETELTSGGDAASRRRTSSRDSEPEGKS